MTLIISIHVASADYRLSPSSGEVVFPMGTAATTTMTVMITTVPDIRLERNEVFTVDIAGTSPVTSTRGTPSTQTLTILSDDGELFLF